MLICTLDHSIYSISKLFIVSSSIYHILKWFFSSYQRGSWGFVGMISKELWDTEEYYVLSSQICVKVLPHVYKRLLNKFGLPWWGCLPHLTDFESSFGFRRSRMLDLTLNIFWNSSERRFFLFAFLFWWLHSF